MANKFGKGVRKIKTGARKTSLQTNKAMVSASKAGLAAGKLMNAHSPHSGDDLIRASRLGKATGRLGRESTRGNTAGNRKRVARVAKYV